MRYFFGFLGAGKAKVEVEAVLEQSAGARQNLSAAVSQGRLFMSVGAFGGNSDNILKAGLAKAGKNLAKAAVRCLKKK